LVEIFGVWNPAAAQTDLEERLRHLAASVRRRDDRSVQGRATPCGAIGWIDGDLTEFKSRDGICAVVSGRPRSGLHEPLTAAQIVDRYDRDGESFIERMRGHFLVAILDEKAQRLLVANDKAGIGTLYFAQTDGWLSFSSSLSGIRGIPDFRADVSINAVHHYLYFSRIPSPLCIYAAAHKFGAASRLVADRRGTRHERYWAPGYPATRRGDRIDERALRTLLNDTIDDIVAEHSGREIGAFLSGGLDSSTMSVLLDRHCGERARLLHVSFDEEAFDESGYARAVADTVACPYHELRMSADDMPRIIAALADAYDEPFGNSSAAAAFFLAENASKLGLDVLIAGDGGDELFGGNERYRDQKLFEIYSALPHAVRAALEGMVKWRGWPANWLIRKARGYIARANVPLPQRLETFNYHEGLHVTDIFTTEALDRWAEAPSPHDLLIDHYNRVDGDKIDRMMYLDLQTTIADDDLRKVVVTSAANGLETRFPFLQDEVVDFATSIPGRRHVPGWRLRAFYRRSVAPLLPAKTLRKPKKGFGLPFGLWLYKDKALYDDVHRTLASLKERNIVKASFIDDFIDIFEAHKGAALGQDLWCLYMLEKWFERHVDTASPTGSAPVRWVTDKTGRPRVGT